MAYARLKSKYMGLQEETVLVSTHLPTVDEFLVLCLTDIRVVYHVEEVDDEQAVRFLNKLTKNDPEQGFEIIQLKMK